MLKKRIIGVVNVLNDLAVQSIRYEKYLPLGRPKYLVENLDRWQADEIFLNYMDISKKNKRPNFKILQELTNLKISTPLIYSGGISTAEDAYLVIKYGADRICINNSLKLGKEFIKNIIENVGIQALIISCPVIYRDRNIYHFDYASKKMTKFTDWMKKYNYENMFAEILITDVENEGKKNSFNYSIINIVKNYFDRIILFGGISEPKQIIKLFGENNVSAIAIGNYLSYKEHTIFNIKKEIKEDFIRKTKFYSGNQFT